MQRQPRRIFLDTNVILDVLQNREGYSKHAQNLLDKDYEFYISALSVANAHYIARIKQSEKAKYKEFISNFNVVDLTADLLEKAFFAATPDLEDGIQIVSCMTVSPVFITRNKQDFEDYSDVLGIFTPQEFLEIVS